MNPFKWLIVRWRNRRRHRATFESPGAYFVYDDGTSKVITIPKGARLMMFTEPTNDVPFPDCVEDGGTEENMEFRYCDPQHIRYHSLITDLGVY